jgi:branched-chain amino acid transport system permease protein
VSYTGFAISEILVIIALGVLLHLQFGRAGIVNFGVVGFVGVGMYGFGVLTSSVGLPFWPALVAATAVTLLLGLVVGWLVLDLDGDSTLVATLAVATIVAHLAVTEKWLTGGVAGLGGVPYPVDAGASSAPILMGLLVTVTVLLLAYAVRLRTVPYGRLLSSIRDNEPLARSLGKSTAGHKLVLFVVTSGAMGLVGALYASVNQFLVPRMLGPGLTFAVWIALVVGGRARAFGPLVGVLVTVALFDLVVEPYLPVPLALEPLLPDLQLMLYGLVLVLVILFRPLGLLGGRKEARA